MYQTDLTLHFPKEVLFPQRSPEWLLWRKTGIGSSDAGILMGNTRYKSVYTLWLEKTGRREAVFEVNADIQRGVDNEDNAVHLYNYRTGFDMQPKTYEHPYYPFLKASMDGINPLIRRFIEVKCPREWKHQKSKEFHFVSPEYYAQIQHQYLVLGDFGRSGMDFLSYLVPEDPLKWGDLVYFEVPPNLRYIQTLLNREIYFWNCVVQGVEPNQMYFGEIHGLCTYF